MTERAIIFSGNEVRAVLDGRKTQTRRIVKPQPEQRWHGIWLQFPYQSGCPFGIPGDRLWAREKVLYRPIDAAGHCDRNAPVYEADDPAFSNVWFQPQQMPRRISRITMEIADVRVHRVQDISEEDAVAEGAPDWPPHGIRYGAWQRDWFHATWDARHGTGAWERNDWVWALTFRRCEQ